MDWKITEKCFNNDALKWIILFKIGFSPMAVFLLNLGDLDGAKSEEMQKHPQ